MSRQHLSPERVLPVHLQFQERLVHPVPAAFHPAVADPELPVVVELARPAAVAPEPPVVALAQAHPPLVAHSVAAVAVRASAEVEQTQSAQSR